MAWSDKSWGQRRQILILAVLISVGILIIAAVLSAALYKAPSCSDMKQDQGEGGVDCGGPCPYLCSVSEAPPTVKFVRAFSLTPGRTDVIAYIDNRNERASAPLAAYTLELYGTNGKVLAKGKGTMTIASGVTTPLFIPAVYLGSQEVTQAFLTFDASSLKWVYAAQKSPVPTSNSIQIQNGPSPKVTAVLINSTAQTIYQEKVIATVFDANNNALGASQTVVPELPAQGSAPIVFTWNQAFTGTPVRVDILPAPTP
jgi:hypothetical protein